MIKLIKRERAKIILKVILSSIKYRRWLSFGKKIKKLPKCRYKPLNIYYIELCSLSLQVKLTQIYLPTVLMVDYLSNREHFVARAVISLSYLAHHPPNFSPSLSPSASQGESKFPWSSDDGCNFWPEVSSCYLPEFPSLACSPEMRRL